MPFDDAGRLRALDEYRVFETPPEEVFDNIARITAQIFETPISLVTFVGEHRQSFKARFGLDLEGTARQDAFCDHALRADASLVVNDALADARFASNPLVLGEPHIRFYCGVPLRTPEGKGLGTLCLIDRTPRTITPRELATLEALARHVEIELEIRRRLSLLEDALGAARAEQRSRDLLAAMVVHDMRGPLTVLTMLASALRPADAQSRADVALLLQEAENLRRMLTDILDVCLHQVGGLRPRRVQVALGPLVRGLADRLGLMARARSRTIATELPEDPLLVDADPELITRVLTNLVTNALDHAQATSVITIALRKSEPGLVVGEVRDQGQIIPESDRARIFEPLEQGSTSLTHRGAGLGLTFCRLAIDAHGGTITVRPNDDGVGNCFAFTLPAVA